MLKIRLLIIFLFAFLITAFSQTNLNNYKYIIVPTQFEFQKNAGDYDLNNLTKFLFKKYGFSAILSNETYPEDLAKNRCLALTAQLQKQSSLFKSKMNVELVNCYNQVVFTTREASSKEKDYRKAYYEATRKTFESFNSINYKYSPKIEEKNTSVSVVKTTNRNDIPVEINGIIKDKKKEIIVKTTEETNTPKVVEGLNILYAQPIKNGFQLVDNTLKKVYIIKITGVKDVFILKDLNGILYKNNNSWIVEYYSDNQLIRKELSIKF